MFAKLQVVILLMIVCESRESSARPVLLQDIDLSASYEKVHRAAVNTQLLSDARVLRSLKTRSARSLEGLYDFCLDPEEAGFHEKWYSTDLKSKCNQADYYRMPVPSAFNDVTSNITVRDYIGWFWYQTTVDIRANGVTASDFSEQYLHFESSNYLTLIWVQKIGSGEVDLVGSHVGGFLPFSIELPRQYYDSKIRLTVAVSNRLTEETIPSGRLLNLTNIVGHKYLKFEPDFDFFHYAGIMGSLNLVLIDKIHFDQIHLTMAGTSDAALFEVSIAGLPEQQATPELYLRCRITAQDGRIISSELIGGLKANMRVDCKIPHSEQELIWSAPRGSDKNGFVLLLLVTFTLLRNNNAHSSNASQQNSFAVIDEYELKTGRTKGVHVSSDVSLSRLDLKDLQGFGMHQEQYFSGRTVSLPTIMKDIYLLKEMGATVVRTSHYPYSADFLDACDESGIMVIAEVQAVGLRSFSKAKLKLHKQLLKEMILRDAHHPSIIMWSIANEPQSEKLESRDYFLELTSYLRGDPKLSALLAGRPLTAAIAQPYYLDMIAESLDVIMINAYNGWYENTGVLEAIRKPLLKNLRGWSRRHRGKPLLVSEFGAGSLAGMHRCEPEVFSEEYQTDLLLEHERVFDEIRAQQCSNSSQSDINPFLGSLVWNFADFSTQASLMRPGGNKKGIFTKERTPKMAARYLRNIYLRRLEGIGCLKYSG